MSRLLRRRGDIHSCMQKMQLHLMSLSIYLSFEVAVGSTSELSGDQVAMTVLLGWHHVNMEHWLYAPKGSYESGFSVAYWHRFHSKSIIKQAEKGSLSFLHIEHFPTQSFVLYPFPTALPPCRHQHSFPKRIHICTMKRSHACPQ